jgi:hypothetical protein
MSLGEPVQGGLRAGVKELRHSAAAAAVPVAAATLPADLAGTDHAELLNLRSRLDHAEQDWLRMTKMRREGKDLPDDDHDRLWGEYHDRLDLLVEKILPLKAKTLA